MKFGLVNISHLPDCLQFPCRWSIILNCHTTHFRSKPCLFSCEPCILRVHLMWTRHGSEVQKKPLLKATYLCYNKWLHSLYLSSLPSMMFIRTEFCGYMFSCIILFTNKLSIIWSSQWKIKSLGFQKLHIWWSLFFPQIFPTPQYYMLRAAQQFICSCFFEPEHVNSGSVPEGTNTYQV